MNTTHLLVIWLLATPPLDKPLSEGGIPTAESERLGVIALGYRSLEECEAARKGAHVSWTRDLPVAGILRECIEKPGS